MGRLNNSIFMTKKTKKKNLGAVAIKHKAVLENLGKTREDGKKPTFKQAAEDAGYSPSYADAGQIIKTKTWEDILDETFPDDYVAEKHNELMNMKRIGKFGFPLEETDENIKDIIQGFGFPCSYIALKDDKKVAYFPIVSETARKAALDMIYKIKKKYDTTITIKGKLSQVSDEEIEDRIAGEVSEVVGALSGEVEERGSGSSK